MEKILMFLASVYLIYCQDQMLWYRQEKKSCKKYKGNCKECNCWSCNRKDYIKGEF